MQVKLLKDLKNIDPRYTKGKVIDCNAPEGARMIDSGDAEDPAKVKPTRAAKTAAVTSE